VIHGLTAGGGSTAVRRVRLGLVHTCRAGIGLASAAALACGQRPARSQLGIVSQVVANTKIEITWRRPVARGRELFGALVPWGRVWTPSADSAARISLSGPIEINGAKLAAGTYGIWAIPDSTSWTVIFNGESEAFHLRYTEGRDVLRVKATPAKGEHVETLSFGFPIVDGDSAVLHLRWGSTIVPLSIKAR
jgi:hypothetical protein